VGRSAWKADSGARAGGDGLWSLCIAAYAGARGMPARRQTRGRTRCALRALDLADRQRVLDWWSLAERRMRTPDGDPSAPAEAVGMSTMIAMVGLPERATPLWIAVRAGYSLRLYVGQFAAQVWPLDLSVPDRDRIVALAATPADDLCDAILAGDDDLHDALHPVATLVTTHVESEFEAVASVEPAFWDGLLQVATYQLQQNLGRVFDVETAEPVLRLGYVLRALDEALGLGSAPDRLQG
jgi:hypothetical protein